MRKSRRAWADAWSNATGLKDLLRRLRALDYPHANMQDSKLQVGLNRQDGPMMFLADQIVKRMGRSGWPSKVQTGYRSAVKQDEVYAQGRSKARAWQSAHQYFEAVDIVHKSMYWAAPPEYWEQLAIVVRAVGKEYGVDLVHGHYWRFVDSAHIELADWRDVRKGQITKVGSNFRPTKADLLERFKAVLPSEVTRL